MLAYIAAFATAATIMISPVQAKCADVPAKRATSSAWAKPDADVRISLLGHAVSASEVPAILYSLSIDEQRVFKRALLRSVKVISPNV